MDIEYVCNQVDKGAKKVNKLTKIGFETDLFNQQIKIEPVKTVPKKGNLGFC